MYNISKTVNILLNMLILHWMVYSYVAIINLNVNNIINTYIN